MSEQRWETFVQDLVRLRGWVFADEARRSLVKRDPRSCGPKAMYFSTPSCNMYVYVKASLHSLPLHPRSSIDTVCTEPSLNIFFV